MIGTGAASTHRLASFRSVHLPGLEISRGTHSGPPLPWRLLPVVKISLLLEGEAELRWMSRRFRLQAGSCMLGAPACTPRIERTSSAATAILHAYIEPRLFDAWMRRRDGPSSRSFQAEMFADEGLAKGLAQLGAGVESHPGESGVRASFDRLLEQVRRLLAAGVAAKRPAQRPEIRRLCEILQERLAEPVTLDELTEEVGLSKFHLVRLFREEVGVPPHAFQLQLRISRAQQLLATGLSGADVAVACGFADQSHFIHCFKRIVGHTPGAFQRMA